MMISDFLAVFFPDEGEAIRLRFFPPRGAQGDAVKYGVTRASLHDEQVQEYIKRMNQALGTYFVVNAGGDKDENITRYNSWFVEGDSQTIEDQHKTLDDCPLPPSIRVQTYKSVHAYWPIEGECSETDWRDMQIRLIAYFDGDDKNKNPSRVMRVPFLTHWRMDDAGELHKCKVTMPVFDPQKRFRLSEMKAIFPPAHHSEKTITYSTGTYPTWDALNAEARRRILSQPGCKVHGEWAKCKGICHDGKSDTGLAVNVASGAYFCQADCDTAHVLRSLGLPEKPEQGNYRIVQQVTEQAELPQTQKTEKKKGVYSVYDLSDKIDELYETGLTPGEHPGWDSLAKLYTVKPGQFTVMTGAPGSGKSQVLDNITLSLAMRCGWKFAVCSLENQPLEQHIATLMEILSGEPFSQGPRPRMTIDTRDKAKEWLNEYYTFLLPTEDNCTIDGLLELADDVRKEHGLNGLIVDPWNEFEHRRPAMMTETQYTSDILSRLRRFGRAYGHHTWLVAHPTKLYRDKEGKYPIPTLYDISGSAHFRNKCDMGLVTYRDLSDPASPTLLYVQKVRFRWCGELGSVELYFDPVTGRYTDSQHVFTGPAYPSFYERNTGQDDEEVYA